MAINQNPGFASTPSYSSGSIGTNTAVTLTANTALDGSGSIGSTSILIYTAPTDGAVLNYIESWHMGTNIATVNRFFINNGSTIATASNNRLFREQTAAANTLSQTAASTFLPQTFLDLQYALPAGFSIYSTVGTTIAAGLQHGVWASSLTTI